MKHPKHQHATSDRIRERAYEIFRDRKGGPGNATSDWLQAERELNAAAQTSPATTPALMLQSAGGPSKK